MNNRGPSPEAVTVVGGGLAGCEAALQLADRGHLVRLAEMRPVRGTPAHRTDRLGELVCTNSLKSEDPSNAHGQLKREMRVLGSVLLDSADASRVPAGSALAVDRTLFSEAMSAAVARHPAIEVVREEVAQLPSGPAVVATGPPHFRCAFRLYPGVPWGPGVELFSTRSHRCSIGTPWTARSCSRPVASTSRPTT